MELKIQDIFPLRLVNIKNNTVLSQSVVDRICGSGELLSEF